MNTQHSRYPVAIAFQKSRAYARMKRILAVRLSDSRRARVASTEGYPAISDIVDLNEFYAQYHTAIWNVLDAMRLHERDIAKVESPAEDVFSYASRLAQEQEKGQGQGQGQGQSGDWLRAENVSAFLAGKVIEMVCREEAIELRHSQPELPLLPKPQIGGMRPGYAGSYTSAHPGAHPGSYGGGSSKAPSAASGAARTFPLSTPKASR